MKARLIRENIDFKRGMDSKKGIDVGLYSTAARKELLSHIQKDLGIIYYPGRKEDRQNLLDQIVRVEKIIRRMLDHGIPK